MYFRLKSFWSSSAYCFIQLEADIRYIADLQKVYFGSNFLDTSQWFFQTFLGDCILLSNNSETDEDQAIIGFPGVMDQRRLCGKGNSSRS